MNRIREKIEQYIHELSNVPSSDALVNSSSIFKVEGTVDQESSSSFFVDDTWKRLLKTAGDLIKETDVNPLCWVPGSIHWTLNDKKVGSPLVLFPVHWKLDKVKNQVEVYVQSDALEINPLIRFVVKEKAGHTLELKQDAQGNYLWQELLDDLRRLGFDFEFDSTPFFANLHYHRFHLLRELELLQQQLVYSQPILQLFDETNPGSEGIALSPSLLTDADTDQLRLFEAYMKGNLVVQGPPGTGKSQVILNLIGKLLEKNQRVMVLSEKRVALEVLEKKLNQLRLGALVFVCHSQTGSKEFLEKLESTWRLLEKPQEKDPYLDLFPARLNQLQLFLDRLNQRELLGGISLPQFLELAEETPFKQAELRLEAPEIKEWLNHKSQFISLEKAWGSFTIIQHIRPNFFQHSNPQRLLETLLERWGNISKKAEISTWKDCSEWYRNLGRLQLVDNAFFSFYSKINAKKSEKRKFEKAVQQFRTLSKAMEIEASELRVWKTIPTSAQVDRWLSLDGFWGKRTLKKELSEYLNGGHTLFARAVEVWKKWWTIKTQMNALEQLFIGWEISPDAAQIEASWYVYEQFEKEGSALFDLAEIAPQKRKVILDLGSEITQFYTDFRLYFTPSDEMRPKDFLTHKLSCIQSLQLASETLKSVPASLFQLLEFGTTWQEIQALVLHSNWVRIETYFPELAQHSGGRLLDKLNELIREQEVGFEKFAASLLEKQQLKFQQYHSLLLTPSAKLSAGDKTLKSQLKRGKAILVKEFGKTRQHQSMRNLLESEARLWIQTCIPIWMSTPGLVANNFPLETNLVDHLIIDEASQLPLPTALGAIQRANQVLIAGDEQQMSPSTFFGKSIKEHDVLHQAGFYFEHTALHHHYRSANTRLIEFSNRHFYNNQLVVYPKPGNSQAVVRHFVENGQYIARINEREAKEVAHFVATIDMKYSLGLVAFSKEQLNAVWKEIPEEKQRVLQAKEEEGTFFMKSLDEVQGDEADLIIISLGYARDENGKFAMRFGPLNQSNGYKRLNVLLTRAIQEIHFFTSVQARDFPLSENENVNLLRQYLDFIEQIEPNETIQFPYGLIPSKMHDDAIEFSGLETSIINAHELLTFIKTLNIRGWKITLV